MSNVSDREHMKPHLDESIDLIASWFPHYKDHLNEHREDIKEHILRKTEPSEGHALLDIEHHPDYVATLHEELLDHATGAGVMLEGEGMTCRDAAILASVDVFMLLWSVVDTGCAVYRNSVRLAALRQAQNLEQVMVVMEGIDAEGQAVRHWLPQFARILKALWSGAGRAIVHRLKAKMSWWQWAKAGIMLVAQIIAFVASEGIALLAKIAALTILFNSTVGSICNAKETCS